MKAFGKRMRGSLAAALSAALIMSGALLAAPAAYAEEGESAPAVVSTETVETPAAVEQAEETPAEDPADEVAAEDTALAEEGEESADAGDAESNESAAPATQAPKAQSRSLSLLASGTPTLTVSEAPRAGGEVTVTGSGFAVDSTGIYLGLGPADLAGFYAGSDDMLDVIHIDEDNVVGGATGGRTAGMNADGSFTVTFEIPALAVGKSYTVYSSKAHGQGAYNKSQDATVAVEYVAPPTLTVSEAPRAGGEVTVTGSGFAAAYPGIYLAIGPAGLPGFYMGASSLLDTVHVSVTNTDGVSDSGRTAKMNADGTFSVTLTVPAVESGKSYAIYSSKAHGQGMADKSQDVTVAVDYVAPPPLKLSVSQTTGLEVDGQDIIVSGEGYNPAQPIYVFYCEDVALPTNLWNLAMGCRDGSKVVYASTETNPDRVKFNADGSFELTFTVKKIAGKATSVYTAANHTAQGDRSQDAKVELWFEDDPPRFTVSKSTGLNPAGEAIIVSGQGYNPAQPIYVFHCEDVALPTNLWDVAMGCRDGAKVVYASTETNPERAKFAADGSFSFEFTVKQLNGATSVYTAANHSAPTDRSQDAKAKLAFLGPEATVKNVSATSSGLVVTAELSRLYENVNVALVLKGSDPTVAANRLATVTKPTITDTKSTVNLNAAKALLQKNSSYEIVVWKNGTSPTEENILVVSGLSISAQQWETIFPTPRETGAGSLIWGVSTEFANYVAGDIAKGRISTSGVGGGTGAYNFPQASSSNWNSDTRTGTVSYRGSVNYYGHHGAINMTFANPVITVSSPISGSLSVNGQTFPLNLGAGSFVANSDGSVTWSNVPVNGVISGGDGGGAGGTVGMDNLTFTIGSVSSANYGSTVTTSPAAQTRTAAPAPPATTGLIVVTSPLKIVAGGEIEITAGGFEPNESGILVVLYSDPVVLDTNAKADANGVVRWIGKLPEGLTGKHTLTLQGSVNVGQEIEIATTEVGTRAAAISSTAGGEEEAALISAPADGTPAWIWWTSAIALLVIAGAATGLVVSQRGRNAATPTHL